jgi:TonB family protein
MNRIMAMALAVAVLAFVMGGGSTSMSAAERPWMEVKGPHFVVASDGGDRAARTILWQFEQVRSAIQNIWPWARADLDRPVLVLLVSGENGMKSVAPQYWEQKGAVHPSSVFVTGQDRHYIALRAGPEVIIRQDVNPYTSAYWSYVSLVLHSGLKADLPLWLSRGLANVMSNTIVRDSYIEVGRIVPWYLQRLRAGMRMSMTEILAVDRDSAFMHDSEKLARFDAETWALVHYLLFADDAAHAAGLNRFIALLAEGRPGTTAMELSLGSVDALNAGFQQYSRREIFSFTRVQVDLKMKPEGFSTRTMTLAETASTRAAFHAAMLRPVEARGDVAAARRADVAAAWDVEGILLERDGKPDEALGAYAKAIDATTTSFYPYYRWAALARRGSNEPATSERIERALERAIALNPEYAPAFQVLAEVKLQEGRREEALGFATRAASLDPAPATYHSTLARVFASLGRHDEALRQARDAVALARSDAERRAAQQLIDSLNTGPRAGGAGTGIGAGPSPAPGLDLNGVYRPGNGITMPRLIHEERPRYTPEAMAAKIEGTVLVQGVVGVDGSVIQAQLVRSLDAIYGLDQEALKAARAWRFEPGQRNGNAVPVMITIELTFKLK